jgi:hypothetical protein
MSLSKKPPLRARIVDWIWVTGRELTPWFKVGVTIWFLIEIHRLVDAIQNSRLFIGMVQ